MVQLISVLVAILLIALVITTDRSKSRDSSNRDAQSIDAKEFYYEDRDKEEDSDSFFSFIKDSRVINFDIYQIKGKALLNIDRRSFREGLKNALENSGKFKLSYNPNIKMVVAIKEDILSLKKYIVEKETKDYFVVKKRVKVTVKFALFRDSDTTYYIDKIVYRADLKASSLSNYDDALYKINKKLYYILGKRVANRLIKNYKVILSRL